MATLVLWSGNWIVARAVRDDISPGLATVGRELIVIAVLLPLTLRGLLAKLPALGRRDWVVIALLGLAGGGPHIALQWLGLHYTTAASGVLYFSTTPIFILLMQLPLGDRITPRQWAGVGISFSGAAIIATQGDVHALTFNIGDLCALFSMMMWAVFEALTTIKIALTLPGTLAVLYSAIGSLLLAFVGWSYVVARMGPSRAGVTMHLMPGIGVLLSIIFLGEYPQWFHFVGIALILSGVALSLRKIQSRGRNELQP
jgi:drug/metabolite transporter (DMT)-like permease